MGITYTALVKQVKTCTLIIGQYAHTWLLPVRDHNLTEAVRQWRNFAPHMIPLSRPSPRNKIWLKKTP